MSLARPNWLLFAEERSDELLKDNSSSIRVSTLSRMIGSFPLSWAIVCLD